MSMHPSARAIVAGFAATAAMLLAGCSPVFNWRVTSIEDSDLVALLPCKPDRASRDIPLGSQSVHVNMAGCEAGDATFAVANARAPDAEQARQWLDAWQKQTRAQWDSAKIEEEAASIMHAAPSPAPRQLTATRAKADGQPGGQVRTVWFAQPQRDGSVAIYQATVLGTPSSAEAAATFFEGLRLP